jgi:hypothetical protein
MAHRRYIPSSTKKYKLLFLLSKFKVAKLNVNGKPDSMVIGPAFMG